MAIPEVDQKTDASLTIRLGLHLDGQRARAPGNLIGDITVGPLGMLNILETQLGLLGEHVSQSERIVQYRNCLAQADSEARFFHLSFEADPLGTSATLLGWRDFWHLHGWNGGVGTLSEPRLIDLCAVEVFAQSAVGVSIAERLGNVLEEMRRRAPAIGAVYLYDPLEAFPPKWRDVLAQLAVKQVPVGSGAIAEGFLGELQRALQAPPEAGKPKKIGWKTDGTVALVQAETCLLAGAWGARQMDAMPSLLVAATQGQEFDAAVVTSNANSESIC